MNKTKKIIKSFLTAMICLCMGITKNEPIHAHADEIIENRVTISSPNNEIEKNNTEY